MMNPSMILQQMMKNNPNYKDNPIANNAMQMLNSGNFNGLKELANNLAKEKGVNIDDIRKQIGI